MPVPASQVEVYIDLDQVEKNPTDLRIRILLREILKTLNSSCILPEEDVLTEDWRTAKNEDIHHLYIFISPV